MVSLELGKIKHDVKDLSSLTKILWSGHMVLGSGAKEFYPNLIPGRSQDTTLQDATVDTWKCFQPIVLLPLCLDMTQNKFS